MCSNLLLNHSANGDTRIFGSMTVNRLGMSHSYEFGHVSYFAQRIG